MRRVRVACVAGTSMLPTLRPGDLVLGARPTALQPGDIILFREPDWGLDIIHRIVDVAGDRITTRGDNNPASVTETVTTDRVAAKVILRLPRIGYAILWIKRHL